MSRGLSCVRILLGVLLFAVCSEWLSICEADQAKMTSVSEEGHGRVNINKRDVRGDAVGERYSVSKRPLAKRAPFRNDLGKRIRSDLGRRLNFGLGKRSPYGHYKLDLGKRDTGEGLGTFHGQKDLCQRKKRTFREDSGKNPPSDDQLRKRRAILEQSIERDNVNDPLVVELEAIWNLEKTLYPDSIQIGGERPVDGVLPNQPPGSFDKRSSYFKNDLGKRIYFKSDLGRRDAFSSDHGKRSPYHWKRIYRTDLGR